MSEKKTMGGGNSNAAATQEPAEQADMESAPAKNDGKENATQEEAEKIVKAFMERKVEK